MSRAGRILATTPQATTWLTQHFQLKAKPSRLPRQLRDWLQQPDGRRGQCRPFTIENDSAQLVVTLLHPEADHSFCLLLETKELGATPGRLRALGLTKRETEVLSWVAQGKSNSEIAIILGAKPRTVSKHLQQIFAKLDVDNRTAAAARARELE